MYTINDQHINAKKKRRKEKKKEETKHTLKTTRLYRCDAESTAVVAVIPASSGSYTGGDQYISLTDVTPIPILRF